MSFVRRRIDNFSPATTHTVHTFQLPLLGSSLFIEYGEQALATRKLNTAYDVMKGCEIRVSFRTSFRFHAR